MITETYYSSSLTNPVILIVGITTAVTTRKRSPNTIPIPPLKTETAILLSGFSPKLSSCSYSCESDSLCRLD